MVKSEGQLIDETTVMAERRFIFENQHSTALREIFRQGQVDFGRIDFSLLDGKVQAWEVNLGPTIGRGPLADARPPGGEEYRAMRVVGRDYFYQQFRTALENIDSSADPREQIPLPLPDSLVRQYGKERQQARRALFHRNLVERTRYSSWLWHAKRFFPAPEEADTAVSLPTR
jgi:hypothetical protein